MIKGGGEDGAYSTALLSTYFGFSFWLCLPLAGIFAAFWGILLGFPVLRLRGDYLAIVTLAFGEIIRLVLINWVELTNGAAGIIPAVLKYYDTFIDDRCHAIKELAGLREIFGIHERRRGCHGKSH